jgi:hypothetical protein
VAAGVVSDPELLDEVAADEEQFGKRVDETNFRPAGANAARISRSATASTPSGSAA